MIRDPESAVAVALCWFARWGAATQSSAVTTRHPVRCGWCDYPAIELIRWLEEFHVVDRGIARSGEPGEDILSGRFRRLPPEHQRRRVDFALYGEDGPYPAGKPIAAPASASGHGVDELAAAFG